MAIKIVSKKGGSRGYARRKSSKNPEKLKGKIVGQKSAPAKAKQKGKVDPPLRQAVKKKKMENLNKLITHAQQLIETVYKSYPQDPSEVKKLVPGGVDPSLGQAGRKPKLRTKVMQEYKKLKRKGLKTKRISDRDLDKVMAKTK